MLEKGSPDFFVRLALHVSLGWLFKSSTAVIVSYEIRLSISHKIRFLICDNYN